MTQTKIPPTKVLSCRVPQHVAAKFDAAARAAGLQRNDLLARMITAQVFIASPILDGQPDAAPAVAEEDADDTGARAPWYIEEDAAPELAPMTA